MEDQVKRDFFRGFSRIFPQRFKPLKNSRKDSKWSYPQYYSFGILRFSQWTKLFIKFISSSLQILDIFRIREATNLNYKIQTVF
jgi:hypothetical protein